MISEVIAQYPWLWTLAWQSTICLAAGLGGSYLLRRRAVRAHQILLLGLIAAMLIPAISQIVRQNQWGLFVAERAVPEPEQRLAVTHGDLAIAGPPTASQMTKAPAAAESLRTVAAPAIPRFKWARVIMPLWLAASAALLLRLASQFVLGRRVVRRSEAADEPRIIERIEAAKDKLAIQAEVLVRSDCHVRSPVIWCWSRRPILLMPEGSCGNPDSLDWASVICHELAHWKRRDHLHGLVAELMICAVPWQPLTWWARRRLMALSEEACDDWVIASGQVATRYAKTLLDLVPQGQDGLVPSVVPSYKGLAGRVHRILHDACGNPHPGLRWTVASITLAVCVILGVAFAQTRPAAKSTMVQDIPPRVGADAAAGEPITVDEEKILLRLVDPNGLPVSGAHAAFHVLAFELQAIGSGRVMSRVEWLPSTGISDADGLVILDAKNFFPESLNKTAVYILHEGRGIGAVHEIARGRLHETLPVVLKAVCTVHGAVDSTDLAAIGMPLQQINTSIHSNGTDVQSLLGRSSSKHDFDFLLPPGEYTLTMRGSGSKGGDSAFIKAPAESADLAITVPEGQSALDLGVIDLRMAKLAAMIGRPAPEIGPMKVWKNGSAVTLAQLRGQAVWLHFGGNGSVAALFLPRLVELHEAYADKGLTVVAIYNCDSMAELEKRWADVDERGGPVPEVPFRIAIDGGESTFYRGTDRERPGATYGRYDVTTMPLDVLIDPAGNVMGQVDLSHAEEALSQMLGEEKVAFSQVPREEQKSPLPNWRPGFNAVYHLADGEILKRVAPPFIPERMEYYRSENGRHPDGPSQLTFHWDGQLKQWGMVVGFGIPDMRSVLNLVLEIQTHEYDGPKSLLDIELPGDWIIRNEASPEVKLKALEELVARDLGRRIRFEQRSVEREAIVATGTFCFHPPVGTYERTSVHLYATQTDPDERGGGGTADSLGKFLQKLGNHVHMPVINRTEHQEDTRIPYRHHRSSYVGEIQDAQERAVQLRRVLDHLTEQTELRFEIRTEPVPVWYVTEQTAP